MSRSHRALFLLTLLLSVSLATTANAAGQPFDPCSLLTPAEIQAVVGKPVKAGVAKVQANPASGAGCTYVIGDFGSLNVLVKPLQSYETPAIIQAQFAKMNMKPAVLPQVGDAAFFTSPGFEMVQLHAFKSGKYILITMLVPGLKEPAVRPLAAKLVKTLLPRL